MREHLRELKADAGRDKPDGEIAVAELCWAELCSAELCYSLGGDEGRIGHRRRRLSEEFVGKLTGSAKLALRSC